MAYIAIVALVAVVALVILVMNGGKEESSINIETPSEPALAGQASAPLPATPQQVYVHYNQIKTSLGIPGRSYIEPWEYSFSGNQICQKLGYTGCAAAFF